MSMTRLVVLIVAAALAGVAASPPSVLAQQKTAAACRKEWQDHKAACQAAKVTERAYVDQCTKGQSPACGTAAAEPPAPAPAPAPAPGAPAGSAGTAGQFDSEAAAKAHCPSDLVVWVNTDTHVYHFAGHKTYGHTKVGKYMCEKEAIAAGNRAAKNEKRPGA